MKKILLYSAVGLLVLALGLYVTAQFFLGSIVKAGVNKFGPSITQTPVELQAATLSPLTGEGTLTGLAVGNPAGWSDATAFRLGKVQVSMEPFSVFDEHIVIHEIVIEQPEFFYETRLVASNIGDILENIEKAIGAKDAQPKAESGRPVKMVVKKLVLRDGTVKVGLGPAAVAMPMPPVTLTDIGVAEGGVTPAQLAFAVMRSVLTGVVAASTDALGKIGGTSGAAAAESVKQVGAALKGLFGGEKKKQ